ncbi:MAG: SufD family Fe-S cluster assembly protein [Puniceicoccales bacterium]|jgi:Fe-S cluster assembly protein SufD|nr:SufD family Fe-S cluster assembly protein [Puniceicoccales bacterium]
MSAVEVLSGPPDCRLEEDNLGPFCWDGGRADFTPLRLSLGAGAHFRYFIYVPPAEGIFQRAVEIDLSGPGAVVEVYGLITGSADRPISLDISLRHSASDTHSLCKLHSIGGERADLSLVGRVTVPNGALRCSSTLQNRNLRLSPTAQLRAIPILDIGAPDARCSHGVTVGEPDRQQLFYMRSRGLEESRAIKLLRDAFAEEIVRHFPKNFQKLLPEEELAKD